MENDRNLANFHQSTWKCQNWNVDGILFSKVENVWAQIYREVMCHDNEEAYKNWRANDLSFLNWHEELHKFWPEHLKVSEIWVLIGSLQRKYRLFELQNYRGVILPDTEELCLFWRKTDLWFEIDYLANFHQSTWKCQNWDIDGILLSRVEKLWP